MIDTLPAPTHDHHAMPEVFGVLFDGRQFGQRYPLASAVFAVRRAPLGSRPLRAVAPRVDVQQ
ncbi:MAG: hypothetical protein ABIR49_09425 [Nitrosospira sp.]